ncbi:MAG: NAD(P)-binding domain-containing protein [Planctomycetia bacterium]|nr:NAD(P)-binding domain-containing protein [Planctomycetia bacterium]
MPSSPHTPELPRWCVIGAGPSGLAALRQLRAAGLDAECLEREDGTGGNWYFGAATSRVFESTRLISSKTLTAFTDFPMPQDYPPYPDHRQCLDYLRSYAQAFDLNRHIRFRTAVERIVPVGGPGEGWDVRVAGAEVRRYAGVVIASGHNHVPRWPGIPGRFTGDFLHAADYKSPTRPVPLAGRRVLVIGGGNSGSDIAVEAARHAALTVHSTRRGYFVVPREIYGRAADLRGERLLALGAPLWLRRLVSLRMIDRTVGLPWRHGLPRPDHRLYETHPVINAELLSLVAAGAIRHAGDVAAFDGKVAVFRDGTRESFDVVICATGYETTLPFIDATLLGGATAAATPRLFMNLLSYDRDDIAVVGLIQPDSGQWGLTDLQAKLVARMATAARVSPRAAAWLYAARRRPAPASPIRYVDSPRHSLEVEHFSYRRRLERLVAAVDRRLRRDSAPHSRMARRFTGARPPQEA